jgi:hypothetical protein
MLFYNITGWFAKSDDFLVLHVGLQVMSLESSNLCIRQNISRVFGIYLQRGDGNSDIFV